MSRNTDLPDVEQGAPVPAFTTGQWPEPAPPADAIDLSGPQRLKPDYFVPPLTIQGPVTSDSFTDVPFDDLPLYIPGLTQNVVGFDGGINKAALEVHRDLGLLCNLLAYLNMAKDDFVELFCDDLLIPVATYNVTQDDVDKSRMIPLYIPRTRLPDGPVNPVFLRVTRLGGTSKETKRFNLKVDTVPPAGRNPIGSTLQNENLPVPVFPEHIINFGVTETDAQNGVPVTFKFYPDDATQEPNTYRATRDRIRLRINGITAPIPPLTESQATGREDITVTLYYGFWQQVRSGSHVCEYEIIDEVGNASLGWSPALRLNVRLNDGSEPVLPEAFILEAPDNVLDHDRLDERDATIFVTTRSPDFALGDIVRVTVRGRSSVGVITTTYDSPPLTSLSFITLPCPNADLRPFISGQFQLFYERIRSGVPNRPSDAIIVDVTGTPIDMRLRPPVVREAPGGVLDPQVEFINVIVRAYPELGQDPFDLVILILEGTYANGTRYYDELYESAGGGDVLFPIANGPNGVIAGLEGGTLRLLYQVDNGDGVRTSMDVTVNVGNAVASLPEPEVMEAPAPLYQFDPEQSTEHANIVVKSNPDFLLNDIVTLYCEGSAPGGTAPAQAFPIRVQWVGRDLRFRLERSYILANIDKTMRIYYTRWRDNVLTRFSHAVNMKVGSRLELQAPQVLQATVTGPDQATLNPMNVLPPNPEKVTVRVVSDKFPPGADIKVFITGKPDVGMPDIPAKPARPEPGENYTSFEVQNEFVAAYLNGECKVFYQLLEIGKTTKSDELTLKVEALPASEWNLVSVPSASSGVIDTSKPHRIEVRGWRFMKPGQPVYIDLCSSRYHELRIGAVVSPGEASAKLISEEIPSSYLRLLKDGDSLEVHVLVNLEEYDDKASAQPLKPVSYTIKKVSGEIVGNVTVRNGPTYLAISSDDKRVYVASTGTGGYGISVFDADTGEIISTHPLGYQPRGLAIKPDGNVLYVSLSNTRYQAPNFVNDVLVLNTSSWGTIKSIATYQSGELCINKDGSKIYAGISAYYYVRSDAPRPSWYGFTCTVINTASNTRESHFNALESSGSTWNEPAVGLNRESTRIYGPLAGRSLRAFNASPYIEFGYFSIDGPPTAFAHSPVGSTLYITSATANKLEVLDNSTNLPLRTRSIEGLNVPWAVATNPRTGVIYVTERSGNTVKLYDSETFELINTLEGFDQPRAIVVNSEGTRMFVANSGSNTVTIVDL